MTQIVLSIETQLQSSLSVASSYCSTTSTPEPAEPTVAGKGNLKGLLVTFRDVGFTLPVAGQPSAANRTTILAGITGYFEPGQMTAVFDTLVATLSCYEMLLYTAQLKRPRQESLASKQAAVEQLLTKLGLSCCSSTQIGSVLKRGISGGQAKRLNIGIALITDPRVLFLDEPTSGLDSFTANEVMAVVSSLVVRDGTTVATTIHSPSSFCFGLFNKLLVLVNGRMIYMGGARDAAINYFTKCCCARQPQVGDNLAEWILEAATQAEREQSEAKQDEGLAQRFKSSHLGQVLLQYRTLRNYSSPLYVAPRVLEKVLFALVVLSLYYGKGTDYSTLNIPLMASLLFLMVLAPMCSAVIYLPGMMLERALFIRERNDGLYRPVTYLVFKLLDELLLMAPVTAGTTAAVFYACSLQGSFLLFWLVHLGTLANGTAMAYFLASLSHGLTEAMPVLCFFILVILLLCGFMIRVAAMPVYWAWAVKANLIHYGWGALLINQYQDHGNAGLGGVRVLSYFGLAGADPWAYLGVVWAFFAGWSFLAWLALAYARSHKR
eukprot:gene8880-9058_t